MTSATAKKKSLLPLKRFCTEKNIRFAENNSSIIKQVALNKSSLLLKIQK
jgi:hypothetical protein